MFEAKPKLETSVCFDPQNPFNDDIPKNQNGLVTVLIVGHATNRIVRSRAGISRHYSIDEAVAYIDEKLIPLTGWCPIRAYIEGYLVWNKTNGGWQKSSILGYREDVEAALEVR